MMNDFLRLFKGDKPYVPTPPDLPNYDPNEEAPKWSYNSMFYQEYQSGYNKKPEGSTKIGVQPASDDLPDWRGVVKSKVNALLPPEVEPIRYNDPNYFWFDTPDYADPFKKLGYLLKRSLWLGVGMTSLYALYTSVEDTSLKTLARLFRKVYAPVVLVSMATGATVVCIANLRGKKDDYWNYAIGGLVGCVINAKYHGNHVYFFKSTWTLLPAVVGLKYNAEINGSIAPYMNPRMFFNGSIRPTAEDGFGSGDYRFWHLRGDPGRDTHHTR